MAAAVLRVPYVRVLAGYDPNIRRPRQQINLRLIENRILEKFGWFHRMGFGNK
jgi:hypothetical protein